MDSELQARIIKEMARDAVAPRIPMAAAAKRVADRIAADKAAKDKAAADKAAADKAAADIHLDFGYCRGDLVRVPSRRQGLRRQEGHRQD